MKRSLSFLMLKSLSLMRMLMTFLSLYRKMMDGSWDNYSANSVLSVLYRSGKIFLRFPWLR